MKQLKVTKGDITDFTVDAIVNAAKNSLLGGGGVDGAIHYEAGSQLLEACKTLNGCPTGEAKITPGFNLKAKYVIHTVGPVWREGVRNESELLKKAYSNSLKLAEENKLKSLAFPNISTGAYGFPKRLAASIAIGEVKKFFLDNKYVKEISFVCFDDENYSIYSEILESI